MKNERRIYYRIILYYIIKYTVIFGVFCDTYKEDGKKRKNDQKNDIFVHSCLRCRFLSENKLIYERNIKYNLSES